MNQMGPRLAAFNLPVLMWHVTPDQWRSAVAFREAKLLKANVY